MRTFRAIGSAVRLLRLSRGLFISSSSRTQLFFHAKLFSCQANSADSRIEGSFGLKVVCTTLLAAEKEEAKALLTLFLKKQGLSNAVAARATRHELTTLEIRDALIPYLEALLEEHGNLIVDVVENFPDPPVKEKTVGLVSQPNPTLDSRKLKARSRVSEIDPAGKLRPKVLYLIELGMGLEQIKGIIQRFSAFAYYSSEGKIKPLVEFLLDLGIAKSDFLAIPNRRPQLCGISLSGNLIPSIAFLESLGVDKKQWVKLICRCPELLIYSRHKVKTTVEFLHEMGPSAESIGKILTRHPTIISYSVEDNLRPTAEYFRSLGVDVVVLLNRCPHTFGLSPEANLKPQTEFFLERGYSIEEVGTMISRFAALCSYSLLKNLIPKWEFFLTMDYSKSTLVKYPQYFGYRLEERIKPRYARMKKCGVPLRLSQLLSRSNSDFENVLKKKMDRMLP